MTPATPTPFLPRAVTLGLTAFALTSLVLVLDLVRAGAAALPA